MSLIKVLIADDMEEIRNYFKEFLQNESNIEVVGLAKSGVEAVRFALKHHPDIVLMDIQMDTDTDGIWAIERITELLPGAKCIVVTIHEQDEYIYRAFTVGAKDYIIKTFPASRVATVINNVYKNTSSLRPEIAHKLTQEFSRIKKQQTSFLYTLKIISKLTTSELIVLKMVYEGATYKQVAKNRYVTIDTVRTQVKSILRKFEMNRMKEVTALLRELKIFESLDYLNKL